MKIPTAIFASVLVVFSAEPFQSVHAAKETFQRTKPHVNIGTIGHVDHGKSSFSNSGRARAFVSKPKVMIMDEPTNSAPANHRNLQNHSPN